MYIVIGDWTVQYDIVIDDYEQYHMCIFIDDYEQCNMTLSLMTMNSAILHCHW